MKISTRNRLIVISWSFLFFLALGGTYFFSYKLFIATLLTLIIIAIYSRLTLCKTCQNSCPFNRDSEHFFLPYLKRKEAEGKKYYPHKISLIFVSIMFIFGSLVPLYALVRLNIYLGIGYVALYYYAWYLYTSDICKSCKNHCPINPNEGYFSWR